MRYIKYAVNFTEGHIVFSYCFKSHIAPYVRHPLWNYLVVVNNPLS